MRCQCQGSFSAFLPVLIAGVLLAFSACGEAPTGTSPRAGDAPTNAQARGGPIVLSDGSYTFEGGPVFDIEATPDGNILVPVTVQGAVDPAPGQATTTIREIQTNGAGGVRDYGRITTPTGVPINGLASIGHGNVYAARGGLDLAVAAAVLQVTPGGARMVADIEDFETTNDPDAFAMMDWKDPQCEWAGPFTGGPQSNPFHLTPVSGNTVLVGDAAGNQLLRVTNTGEIEVVAVFTPPTSDGSLDPDEWMMHPKVTKDDDNDPETGEVVDPCYVQPVPTSVAVGPDGAMFVGELTGLAEGAPLGAPLGKSRVWRIEPGTENTVCPSANCERVFQGLTSIIDLAFGPDGDLYVVEYDENGWLSVVVPAIPTAGGTVNRCDLVSGMCEVAEIGGESLEGLTMPAAIAFDPSGHAWLLENNLVTPTVRRLGAP